MPSLPFSGVRAAVALLLGLALAVATAPAQSAAAPPAGTAAEAAAEAAATAAAAAGTESAELPGSFQWSSSGPLISPRPDAQHNVVSVKDPTVIRYNDRWHVYMTTANTAGSWSLAHTSFSDWSQASSAPHYFLDTNPNIGTGYRAAPQVFYFAPKDEWYLVYQTGLPSFSTTDDPSRPESWSAPRNFQQSMPPIIQQNIGNGYWVDFWVICDDVNCYLFSSDDNGHLYRSQTTVEEFPNGFDETVIAMEDSRYDLFEAANIYRVKGTDSYLLLVEAIGTDGKRYFRSWLSDRIDGTWEPLADTRANPFADKGNVGFPSGAWTQDISHGELLRDGVDQTLTIDPCDLRFLYQGTDPSASGEYSQLPWRLGLLTQTNSTC